MYQMSNQVDVIVIHDWQEDLSKDGNFSDLKPSQSTG